VHDWKKNTDLIQNLALYFFDISAAGNIVSHFNLSQKRMFGSNQFL
jgi:hypothetical protein